jgi:hypothetical protein
MIAAIRPEAWNLPLLLHVAGAMLLVSMLVLASAALVGAGRSGPPAQVIATRRFGFRALAWGALPAYLLMRVGAEWIVAQEGGRQSQTWIEIGSGIGDFGLLVLIVTTIIAWVAARGARDGGEEGIVTSAPAALTLLLLAAFVVAIWAMTGKPS